MYGGKKWILDLVLSLSLSLFKGGSFEGELENLLNSITNYYVWKEVELEGIEITCKFVIYT